MSYEKKQVGAPINSQGILKYLRLLKFNRLWQRKVMVLASKKRYSRLQVYKV